MSKTILFLILFVIATTFIFKEDKLPLIVERSIPEIPSGVEDVAFVDSFHSGVVMWGNNEQAIEAIEGVFNPQNRKSIIRWEKGETLHLDETSNETGFYILGRAKGDRERNGTVLKN